MVAKATSWKISSGCFVVVVVICVVFFFFLCQRYWLSSHLVAIVAKCPYLIIRQLAFQSECAVWSSIAPSEPTYPRLIPVKGHPEDDAVGDIEENCPKILSSNVAEQFFSSPSNLNFFRCKSL